MELKAMSWVDLLVILGFFAMIPLAGWIAGLEERIINYKVKNKIYPYCEVVDREEVSNATVD